jgi:hypothetical protein
VHIIGEALALVPLHESAQGQLPTYAGHALMSEEGSEPDIESRRVEVAEVRIADPDRFLADGCQLEVEAINCAANRPPIVPE